MITAIKKEKGTEVMIGGESGKINRLTIIQEFVSIYAALSKNYPEELELALEIIQVGEKEGLIDDLAERED